MVETEKNDYIKLKNNSLSGDIDTIEILAQKTFFTFFVVAIVLFSRAIIFVFKKY